MDLNIKSDILQTVTRLQNQEISVNIGMSFFNIIFAAKWQFEGL